MNNKKELKELELVKEINDWEVLADGLLDVVKTGNLKYIRQFYSQDVKKAYQKDYDDRNIKREVDEWVDNARGVFYSTEIAKDIGLKDARYISKLLKNLEKEGKINKSTDRAGKWRKVDNIRHEMKWWKADGKLIGLVLPLGIHEQTLIYGQTMIAIAGKWNAGKSAMCLEIAVLNYGIFNNSIDYILCSEMGPNRFRRRLTSGNVDAEKFRNYVEVFEYRGGHLPDLIRPNKLTIIDYIAPQEDGMWKIHGILEDINDNMGSGIVVVAMQKPRDRETAFGGDFSVMIPSIYLSLDDGLAKIVKAKEFDEGKVSNPAGKIMPFKIHGGFHFEALSQWHRPEDDDAVKEAGRR